MRVTLNGHDRDVPDGCSVDELIRHAGLDPLYVIVERNAEPVERKRYPEVAVEDGDRIELVRAVAGG